MYICICICVHICMYIYIYIYIYNNAVSRPGGRRWLRRRSPRSVNNKFIIIETIFLNTKKLVIFKKY